MKYFVNDLEHRQLSLEVSGTLSAPDCRAVSCNVVVDISKIMTYDLFCVPGTLKDPMPFSVGCLLKF